VLRRLREGTRVRGQEEAQEAADTAAQLSALAGVAAPTATPTSIISNGPDQPITEPKVVNKSAADGALKAIGKAGAVNAALFAVAILANDSPDMAVKLAAFREQQTKAVKAAQIPQID
jgi:hypothetical protein